MSKVPEMTPVDSTMLSHSHYDPNTRKMTVRFKNGLLYEYDDVPAEKNDAFLGNASKGRYFNERIKSTHPGRKVSE